MGIIEKQIRKRGNQKLAETLSTPTRLQPPEVAVAIEEAIERHNQAVAAQNAQRQAQAGGKVRRFLAEAAALSIPNRSYYLKTRESDMLISYEKPVDEVLARIANKRRKPGLSDGYWLSHVRVMRDEAGQNRVEVKLTNWVMNSNGKLGNKDKYHELTDMIWEAVSTDATDQQQDTRLE